MKNSTLTKKQVKHFRADTPRSVIIAEVRHDDECGNGHNTFAITAEIYEPHRQSGEPTVKHGDGRTMWLNGCGCCHDEIRKHFPQLAPFIRWHLMSTEGPMHYAANALYWAGHCGWRDGKKDSPPNLDHLKSTIIYGALPDDQAFDLQDHLYSDARGFTWNEAKAQALKTWLEGRSPALLEVFQKDVESLGFAF